MTSLKKQKNKKPLRSNNLSLDAEGYEGLVETNDYGSYSLFLLVKGIYCAACIQKIEREISSFEEVSKVRLNFSTGRLFIEWSGSSERANHFVSSIQDLGYDVFPYSLEKDQKESDKQERFLLICLGVAGFAVGNIMLLSIGLWSTTIETMGGATRNLFHLISALIAVPTVLFSGRPFFFSAWSVLSKRKTNMDVPISVALVLAVGVSLFELFRHGEHVYFDSAVMLIFFLLVGRYFDFRARKQVKRAATDLMKNFSGFVTILDKGKPKKCYIKDVKQNMSVLVSAGEKIAVDGIAQDEAVVDGSLITGETKYQNLKQGYAVYSGMINVGPPFVMVVQKCAENSLLADVIKLMEVAEQGQADYVRLAEKVARFYTPIVHFLALFAFAFWFFVGGLVWQESLMIAVTVLIITCPCALGLAVPIVQVLASGLLMKRHILIKSSDALERLADINAVIFDKTGTLTQGKPKLIGDYENHLLSLASSLACYSSHPLAKSLSAIDVKKQDGFNKVEEIAGFGLKALYKGKDVKLGSAKWCGVDLDDIDQKYSCLCLKIEGDPPYIFRFEDTLKEDAFSLVSYFKKERNMPVSLLSGDMRDVVADVANRLNIPSFKAEQTPVQKYGFLKKQKEKGSRILMVGDGLNDAPVLLGSDVSMAPGSALDVAQNAADIVFMGDKLASVEYCHKMALKVKKMVRQNFGLAIIYNVFAIPFAFFGGVTPMVAAIAMSLSSLVVVANSYRLRIERV